VGLELSKHVADGHTVVELRGELDVSTVADLRDWLFAVLGEDRTSSIILDLSGLSFMDSTGLGVLVATERRAHQLGGALSLAGPQKIVARALHTTSLDKHFPIFPTVDEALLAAGEANLPADPT
jgi:anti-sigma B factor antagonist